MSSINSKGHERLAVLAVLPPASASGARTSGYFNPGGAHQIFVMFHAGVSSGAGTYRIVRASDSAGSGSENASATIAFGGSGGTGNNILHTLSLQFPSKYQTAAKPYLAIQLGEGGTYLSEVTVLGLNPRYAPADQPAAVVVDAEPAVA